MIVFIALACTTLAALSGILAVGSGRHWHFALLDYFRGKRNAMLYLWVTASTVLSIYNSALIMDYGLRWGWQLHQANSWRWFITHALYGLLFTFAHIFVSITLSKEVGPVDKYLWGKGTSSADQ